MHPTKAGRLAAVLLALAPLGCSTEASTAEPGPTDALAEFDRALADGDVAAATVWREPRWAALRDDPATRKAAARVLRDHAGPRAEIAPAKLPGRRLRFDGRIVDAADRPVDGAWLYVYQADTDGRYAPEAGAAGAGDGNPRLFAWIRADRDGRFTIETILPGPYGGAPPHFHFGMTRDPAVGGRGSRVYFDDGSPLHPEIASDAAAGHAYIARLTERDGGLAATATFRLPD